MLKLGIIGASEGNGHPYSWSAIINGYSPEVMKSCEYPSIPDYLGARKWPDDRLTGAQVTHIWTQSKNISQKIANASLIPNIVDSPQDMIGLVDGVLLARDDAKNHLFFAKDFIDAGIPIYIDKPIALNKEDLEELYKLEKYDGQIFSCSPLRFSPEFQFTEIDRGNIGEIKYIYATTPKTWEKYSVHIIDPIINIIGVPKTIRAIKRMKLGSAVFVRYTINESLQIDLVAFGDLSPSPLEINFYGVYGHKKMEFMDSFSAFKNTLHEFLNGINNSITKTTRQHNSAVVEMIEFGQSDE